MSIESSMLFDNLKGSGNNIFPSLGLVCKYAYKNCACKFKNPYEP